VNHDNEIMPYTHLEALIPFSKNLSLMRKMMAENTDARIMLGGKHEDSLCRDRLSADKISLLE
jgi:hypothetical protein